MWPLWLAIHLCLVHPIPTQIVNIPLINTNHGNRPLNKLLSLRVALIIIAALLGAIGINNGLVAVFFQSKYEIVYNFDVTAVYCAQGQCAYSAGLTVANTGKRTQEQVSIVISGLPPDLGGSPRITNFSAAEPRSADPEIRQHYENGTGTIQLNNLTPGAMVQFTFSGNLAESRLPKEGKTKVTVKSKGKQIKGDPRAITFGRYVG